MQPITLLWEQNIFSNRCNRISQKDLISKADVKLLYDCIWPSITQPVAIAKANLKKGPTTPRIGNCKEVLVKIYFPTVDPNICEILKIDIKGNSLRGYTHNFKGIVPEENDLAEIFLLIAKVKKIAWDESILDIVHDPYENQIDIAINNSKTNENTQSRRKSINRRGVHGVPKKIQSGLGKRKVRIKSTTQRTKAGT